MNKLGGGSESTREVINRLAEWNGRGGLNHMELGQKMMKGKCDDCLQISEEINAKRVRQLCGS